MPASALDVAQFILEKQGPMTAMKLQKLVYYCQAWSLVWEKQLFPDAIEAWANGPVTPRLYRAHRKMYEVSEIPGGDSSRLNSSQRDTIRRVLKFYGHRSGQWLSDLSHRESPWKDARKGLDAGEGGNEEITPQAMCEYYGSL